MYYNDGNKYDDEWNYDKFEGKGINNDSKRKKDIFKRKVKYSYNDGYTYDEDDEW